MTTESLPRTRAGIVGTLSRIGDLFVSIAAAQSATAEFDRTNRRADAQLTAMGMHGRPAPAAVKRDFA